MPKKDVFQAACSHHMVPTETLFITSLHFLFLSQKYFMHLSFYFILEFFFQVVKHFLRNVSPFKIDELLKMEKELFSPSLLCRLPEPSSPPAPLLPPFRPPSVTHAHSPLIGRLPQVAVELGRAPQKRRLRASALASSRCDKGEKKNSKHTTTTHDDGKTCSNQVDIY